MLGFVIDLKAEDNGAYTATSPSFPELSAQANNELDATANLKKAVEKRLLVMLKEKKIIPVPTKVNKNRPSITFPVLIVAKIYLANTMIEKRIQKTELAKRLGCHMQQVDRLLDLCHASKIERVEEALKVLGRGLELRVTDSVQESLSVKMLKRS